jgi:2-methylisocitrate lyase-like PEP mutase family enzyme
MKRMDAPQHYYVFYKLPIHNQQMRHRSNKGSFLWFKNDRNGIGMFGNVGLWFALVLVLPCIQSLQSSLPPPARLQQLLQSEMDGTRKGDSPILLPCCYDGLTARLVARHHFDPSNELPSSPQRFEATFLTGFGASASYGIPDTQLISYQEMLHTCAIVSEALASVALEQSAPQHPIPCIAVRETLCLLIYSMKEAPYSHKSTLFRFIKKDGDTGYGNAMNVKRTVFGYGRANMAGIMLEDQVAPKRCGHVTGKRIVPLNEAVQRIRAACDARDEYCRLYGPGTGPLILARTDACTAVAEGGTPVGFAEAMKRCALFREVGADMTFLEAPESVEQMREYCRDISGPKLANMLEYGTTPILAPSELKQMGYTMAAYPLTLLSASIKAMQQALDRIITGQPTEDVVTSFVETKDIVGFTQYFREEGKYK